MSNEKQTTDLALVKASDLALVQNNMLNDKQLQFLLKKTPKQFLRKRPAKGGGEWEYVSGGYVKKVLNIMFGWDWDFIILEQLHVAGEAIVKGKLVCRVGSREIVKMQFGNHDVTYRKQSQADLDAGRERVPLSLGNDFKSAATDCLKKCASELGIAADIYNKDDFREVRVQVDEPQDWEYLAYLFHSRKDFLDAMDAEHIGRIINQRESASYAKVLAILKPI